MRSCWGLAARAASIYSAAARARRNLMLLDARLSSNHAIWMQEPRVATTERQTIARSAQIFSERRNSMAFCANCGAAVTGGAGFCGACGRALGTSPQVVAQSVGAAVQTTAAQPAVAIVQPAALGLTSHVAAALTDILAFV